MCHTLADRNIMKQHLYKNYPLANFKNTFLPVIWSIPAEVKVCSGMYDPYCHSIDKKSMDRADDPGTDAYSLLFAALGKAEP